MESPASGFSRQIRSGMLFKGKTEEPHFGLYSYLLLGRPSQRSQSRTIQEVSRHLLTEILRYDPLSNQFTPQQLNITYLPVTRDLPVSFNVDYGFWRILTTEERRD